MAKFGYFSGDGKEYIIDKPLRPIRHLINFSWNKHVISGVNQFGTGEGVFNNQTLLYNDPVGRARMIKDGRRYFYIRDDESGAYWNIGYFPVKHEPFELKTVFGPGYSKFIHTTENIQTEALSFAAHDEPVEIWKIRVINKGQKHRRLKIYPYVEWLLQGYPIASDYYSYLKSEYIDDINAIISFNLSDERPHERYSGFVASDIRPTGYTGSVREFMGTYGEPTRPQNVVEGACSCRLSCNENLAGALEIPIVLEPGEEKELTVLIGNTSDIAETTRIIRKIFSNGYVENSFNQLKSSKDEMIRHTFIQTPDERINNLVNIWAKNQVTLCAEFGRDGVRGFRDTLQDAWAITSFNPILAKEKIIESLKHQYRNGSTLRGWMPVMKKHYSDGPTWITPAVTEYVKYTGDESILDEIVPYFDKEEGTVLEHMLAALRHLNEDKGIHGLCLAHCGDWNDSLDWMGKNGKGESVMTSMAHYRSLNLFIELAVEILKNEKLAGEMYGAAEDIKNAIEKYAWDGEWYIQGYSDSGRKVGSAENEQGSIFLVPQAWAVYSGVASADRAKKCLKSAEKYLSSKTGFVMCDPPFTKRDDNVGRLTVILPGMYENASTYCHASAFMIAAYINEANADAAVELYREVMPDSDGHPSDISGVEPYAFTNQYLGPQNKRAGVSVSGWITGTAGWMYKNMVNNMLGLQPGYNGLYINPCIPGDWDSVSVETMLRGYEYNISIKRDETTGKSADADNAGGAVKKITVNGESLTSAFIPYGYKNFNTLEIEIILSNAPKTPASIGGV